MIGDRKLFRAFAVIIAFVFLFAAMEANAGRTKKPTHLDGKVFLNEHVTIKSNVIRIGDLFSNTGKKAHVPIAYAPAPGQRLILDANWLYRAASVYKLKWKPFTLHQQAIVVRDSTVFSHETIKDRIRAALLNQGIDKADEIELGDRLFRIHAPNEANTDLNVAEVSYDKRSGRFTATLTVTSDKPGEIRRVIGGWVRKMTAVPVLTRRLSVNEVIKKRDIKWIRARSKRIHKDIITNADDLIGKSLSRNLPIEKPIRRTDVRPPILVKKGSMVSMILQSKFMRLESRGQALDEGGKGDVVRIRISKSKKEIEAVVIGPGQVSIKLHGNFAMK